MLQDNFVEFVYLAYFKAKFQVARGNNKIFGCEHPSFQTFLNNFTLLVLLLNWLGKPQVDNLIQINFYIEATIGVDPRYVLVVNQVN